MELNEIMLNSIPNIWIKQAYVQEFDFESITIKAAVNMFEWMEIAESIYEGAVEFSYRKRTRWYYNRAGNSRKMRG